MTIKLDLTEMLHCNACGREMTHLELGRRSLGGLQFEEHAQQERQWQVLACRQCGHLTYRTLYRVHSFGGDPYVERTDTFPPPSFRPKPKWYTQLDEKFRLVLDELYQALDHSLFFIASTGTRTALDVLIVDQIGDIGGFKDKVNALVKQGILEFDQGEILSNAIDAGSASAHRGFKPDVELMKIMMDITEHIFYRICIESHERSQLKAQAKKLAKQVPTRS